MEREWALCGQVPPLAGHRVGITADRRADEQAELLRRLGAEVMHAPVLRTLPLADDAPMRDATAALLVDRPTKVVITTGIGLRSWISAAESWGLADELIDLLGSVPLYVRGPKAYGAALQLGLQVHHREPTERLDAMIDVMVAEGDLEGGHVAIQLYGNDAPWASKSLEAAGATVTSVPVYRWVAPDDEGPARRLVREALDGQLTVVTFTSPSAVTSLCRIAEAEASLDDLLDAFATRVAAACVGPFTEEAALARGITVACAPERGRLGLLVRSLSEALRQRHVHLQAGGRELVLQGSVVMGADVQVSLPDRERQVLTVLAERVGRVVPRQVIERDVWRSTSEDRALDAVLSRLRRSLAPTGLEIETRVRRGYQLRADVVRCPLADAA